MEETRYIISDAAKKLEVEPHVLRYWEEELELEIPRNEMGHRYYREKEIKILRNIQELKNNGFQLRAIKMILPEMQKNIDFDVHKLIKLRDEFNEKIEELDKNPNIHFSDVMKEDKVEVVEKKQELVKESDTKLQSDNKEEKMYQFQTIMTKIIENVLVNHTERLGQAVSENISERILKELDYLFRMREEQEEERFKKLDENIREFQRVRAEIASSEEGGRKRKRRFRR